jgi:hypothetical protein
VSKRKNKIDSKNNKKKTKDLLSNRKRKLNKLEPRKKLRRNRDSRIKLRKMREWDKKRKLGSKKRRESNSSPRVMMVWNRILSWTTSLNNTLLKTQKLLRKVKNRKLKVKVRRKNQRKTKRRNDQTISRFNWLNF